MYILPPVIFLSLVIFVLICVSIDGLRKRKSAGKIPVTVVVPCFNDADTLPDTLRSIYSSWPHSLLEVLVIDDASTDDSLARMQNFAREYPVRIIRNTVNKGKSASLNDAVQQAAHDPVICLDADTRLSAAALTSLLDRLAHDSRVGAASCPYRAIDRGFLPAMQSIEYSMLRLGQGAGNVTSALALWGGCLMVRKQAFFLVSGFSGQAITEDVDLAFKLNRAGWKVEQSFVFVETHVPPTWRQWIRQKIRWTAGGFQCFFEYPDVWLRNPVQMLFIFSYAFLTLAGLWGLLARTSWLGIGASAADLWAAQESLADLGRAIYKLHGPEVVARMLSGLEFSLFSLIYVLPTITRLREWPRVALFIPYSIGYFPFYIFVSLRGLIFWFRTLRKTQPGVRAW
ncbi:MAG: glycosyltransferase family 2 protein [Kiritimatiellia bacterium]|nr:glycosyltransferase family 2 protein [Kiritimatiellia bacterium]